jgi:hypothetical protein
LGAVQPSTLVACLFLLGGGLLGGCDTEKARAIQGAAVQFRVESLAAVQAIDDMHRQELEAPTRSPGDVRREFVTGILTSKSEINSNLVDLALDPYKTPVDPQWQSFIADLRSQYTNFAAIFDKLDAGNLVAVEDVRQSAEYARKLTVQMALMADVMSKNPPVLYRQRNAIVVKLRRQRQSYQSLLSQMKSSYGSTDAAPQAQRDRLREIENQVGELMGDWQAIQQQEQKLMEATVTQCLKAAVLGKELGQLINQYDKLDLNQINTLIPRILGLAATVSGRDFTSVQLKATGLISEIKEDPLWRDTANSLLNRVNDAVSRRNPPTPSISIDLPNRMRTSKN